jgi:hypothetical protein
MYLFKSVVNYLETHAEFFVVVLTDVKMRWLIEPLCHKPEGSGFETR